jgi:hypothetical protein
MDPIQKREPSRPRDAELPLPGTPERGFGRGASDARTLEPATAQSLDQSLLFVATRTQPLSPEYQEAGVKKKRRRRSEIDAALVVEACLREPYAPWPFWYA